MKVNNIIMILIMILVLISFASAEVATLGNYNQDECVNLVQTCSNCTYMNITSIKDPTSRLLVGQEVMTGDGKEYNYTFCDTTMAGNYIVNGFGDVNGDDTVWAYDFNILGIGSSGNKNITEIAFFVAIALFISFFMYLKISKYVGSLLIFIIGLAVLFTLPANGWIGWIVIASGLLMLIFSAFEKKKRYR